MADASCSATSLLLAHLPLIHGTATKVPHLSLFTSHPRYSVAVLLTSPLVSTTQPQGIISNTPQVMRGVRVCACGCVSAKEKCKTFTCSAFSHSARKLSAALSFFFCGIGRLTPPICISRISVTYTKVRSLVLALKRTQITSPHCVWAERAVFCHRGLWARCACRTVCGGTVAYVNADARGKMT